jgi:hypothetical protein
MSAPATPVELVAGQHEPSGSVAHLVLLAGVVVTGLVVFGGAGGEDDASRKTTPGRKVDEVRRPRL